MICYTFNVISVLLGEDGLELSTDQMVPRILAIRNTLPNYSSLERHFPLLKGAVEEVSDQIIRISMESVHDAFGIADFSQQSPSP